MGVFDISFTDEPINPRLAIGKITLGDMWELFEAALSFWSTEDYERSWTSALRRVLDAEQISCLLTSVTDPAAANFVTAWPLYRSGEDVHVQNRLIFLDELDDAFDPAAPWESVGPRATVDEEGNKISEWCVPARDIDHFLRGRASV